MLIFFFGGDHHFFCIRILIINIVSEPDVKSNVTYNWGPQKADSQKGVREAKSLGSPALENSMGRTVTCFHFMTYSLVETVSLGSTKILTPLQNMSNWIQVESRDYVNFRIIASRLEAGLVRVRIEINDLMSGSRSVGRDAIVHCFNFLMVSRDSIVLCL